ncbi:MAG: hypothetical protein F2763_07850 [Actinobacteria bacterium]|uniref:Unannotated protein n=1 Tax=freshwater metagenome TaxID=449393 RepID=A0A6J7ANV4_9ZZZZ|nr:hypothetical protein [Actinomycetota bacterium]
MRLRLALVRFLTPLSVTAALVVLVTSAEPVQAASGNLVFATFNVCKVDCAAPAPPWDIRRDRVARVIGESGADVVGLQEATNNPTTTAKTQVADIQTLLAPAGYVSPFFTVDSNECRRPRDAQGELTGPSPCDNSAALLYRTATIEQVTTPTGLPSAGIVQVGSIAPGIDAISAARSVAWAYLRGKNGAGPFLAISLHLDSNKDATAETSRVAVGQALGGWVNWMNGIQGMSNTPVILMADLNSYAKRQPNGVQMALTSAGWIDAHSARSRRNIQYSTINYNPRLGADAQGFPAAPYKFHKTKKNPNGEATRIDYIMGYGTGLRVIDYEVVIYLTGKAFNTDYQASDHQMVKATFAFP